MMHDTVYKSLLARFIDNLLWDDVRAVNDFYN